MAIDDIQRRWISMSWTLNLIKVLVLSLRNLRNCEVTLLIENKIYEKSTYLLGVFLDTFFFYKSSMHVCTKTIYSYCRSS